LLRASKFVSSLSLAEKASRVFAASLRATLRRSEKMTPKRRNSSEISGRTRLSERW